MPRRRILGRALIGAGILVIGSDVLWMIDVADGPGTGPKTFDERRTYDETKQSMHQVFPIGFAIGLVGLAIALVGGRLARDPAAPSA
jgi:hypothetical protein